LLSLSIDLASTNEIGEVLDVVARHVLRACGCKSAFFVPRNGTLVLAWASKNLDIDEKEMTAANWTYRHGSSAGNGTETLSSAALAYYPLRTPNGVVGVMGVQAEKSEALVKFETERLLRAFANQAGLAIERSQLWNLICKAGTGPVDGPVTAEEAEGEAGR